MMANHTSASNTNMSASVVAAEIDIEVVAAVGSETTATATTIDTVDMMNQFIIRMHINPFRSYPNVEITPVYHTQSIPQSQQPESILSSALSYLSFHSNDPLPSPDTQEEQRKEEEWAAIWQHLNDFIVRDAKTIFPLAIFPLQVQSLAIVTVISLWWIIALRWEPGSLDDDTEIILTSFYGGLVVILFIFLIMFMIHTIVMYRQISTNTSINMYDTRANYNRIGTYTHEHSRNVPTMNRHLRLVAGLQHRISTSSSCIAKLVPFVVIFGVWTVVSYIIYQIEKNGMSHWCHVILFLLPIVAISFYVLYQIGGCVPLVWSCRNRYIYTINQRDDVLKRIYFETKRYSDVLTYFTLKPKIRFDMADIAVDVYYKSTMFERNSLLLPQSMTLLSSPSNLGIAKRRGGGGDHNDGFITMIDSSNEQPAFDNRYYDDENDSISTPLLMKDATV